MVKKGYRQTPEHIRKRMANHPQKNRLLTCRVCKIKVPRERIKKNNGFCNECVVHTKLCDCGCGELMFRYTKKGKIAQFVDQGHRNKVVGKKVRQQAANNPEYAAHISKIKSQAAKKLYQDKPKLKQERREQMKRRYEDPEEVEKTRQQQIERWSDPEEREKQRQRQLDFIEENPEITELRTQASRAYWSDEDNKTKKSKQYIKKFRDPSKHPRWEGGISNDPYDEEWNSAFRKFIRERQDYICADNDITCSVNDKKLAVHHIDGNKLNSIPENCIALCNSHHPRAHNPSSRLKHKKFIEVLMQKETSCD